MTVLFLVTVLTSISRAGCLVIGSLFRVRIFAVLEEGVIWAEAPRCVCQHGDCSQV